VKEKGIKKRRRLMNVNVRSFPKVYEIGPNDFDNELNALLDRLLATRVERNESQPSVSGMQTANAYFVDIKLPGASKEDVEVRFENGNLTIQSVPDEARYGTERKAGVLFSASGRKIADLRNSTKPDFKKIYRLPIDADPKGISASFCKGVLSLEISRKAIA
jgi:HSP20 family molecular chaperone IbpA